MSDILIRTQGRAGRITLNRPDALNALTAQMAQAIDETLIAWQDDPSVALVVIDATGTKAFCAGGDIADLYARGRAGDFAFGQAFWREEYQMNARLGAYPKPVVSLMQGFTMGGGVGVGCHVSHRIVGDSSRISMPECGIGLVPDVGGSLLLARAPARLGSYLALTCARMDAGDAIAAGFADHYLPEALWPALIESLCQDGDVEAVARSAQPAPQGGLLALAPQIARCFATDDLAQIEAALEAEPDRDFASLCQKQMGRNAPLAMACALEMLARLRSRIPAPDLRDALEQEFRFTSRAMAQGDFLEGVRALIIDKDKTPRWQHAGASGPDAPPPPAVPAAEIEAMLAPLPPGAGVFDGD